MTARHPMMLDHLREPEAARAVLRTLGDEAARTRDLQGRATTEACGKAVAAAIG